MPELQLKQLVKTYGSVRAIDNLNLDVRDGELVTLLGPSGCGKTTTLRSISGFLNPDSGSIYIGSRNITSIPPEKRKIGLVFQNYALWPHMTIYQNLAFGMQIKKMPKNDIRNKVEEVLSVVQLQGFEDRYPRQLSGGQQQRVALARAIGMEPEILLLDEPLSNLDALLREQMRFEIAQLHKRLGLTTIYVTHDQTEAMVISDRIVILKDGKIMQEGPPKEIYLEPANKFVAGFMGATLFLKGTVKGKKDSYLHVRTTDKLDIYGRGADLAEGTEVSVALRPEAIAIAEGRQGNPEEINSFNGTVTQAYFVGEGVDYQLKVHETIIRAKQESTVMLPVGTQVRVTVNPDRVPVLAE